MVGLGSAGCASTPTASGGNGGATATTARVATVTKPGTGKGHWVNAPTTDTGTFLRKRVWIPDDGSGPVTTPGSGVQSYSAPRVNTGGSLPNGRGFGGG